MNEQMTETLKRFPMPELVFHETAESIFNEHWNFEKDLTFEELLQCECGGGDDERAGTLRETFAATKENGFWAFTSTRDGKVHVWFDGKQFDTHSLFFLIGHEIGHLLEEHFQAEVVEDEYLEYLRHENNSDLWGVAAVLTYRLVQQYIALLGDRRKEGN